MGDYKAAKLLFDQHEEYVIKNNRGEIIKKEGWGSYSEDFMHFRDVYRKHIILQNIMKTDSVLPDDVKRVVCSFVNIEPSRENLPNSCEEHNMWVEDICPDCGDCPVCNIDSETNDWKYDNNYGGNSYYDRKTCNKCYEMTMDGYWPDD